MKAAAEDSYSGGYERDFMKQTMLEHEAVFKNQVHELHRLYRIQRNLVDEVKGKNLNEDMNLSDRTFENGSKRQLPGFLLANSTYGEGSSAQACNGRLQNGVSSKDGDLFEVRPMTARRKMIDLQLPADEYLDADETGDTDEITICAPYKRSKSGRGDASQQSNSSGSCLDVKNSNGLADLNEPLKWQDSEPVSLSRDMYSHYGRNNADVQGHWLEKNRSQNGLMNLEAGLDRSTQRDQLHLPSHSVQAFSNNAFQPQSYPATDHSKVKYSGERAYRELEVRSKNPQASHDSYVDSSVASNVPRLHNDYRPDFVGPWSHWSSSWGNPRSSSHQKSYPVQTNPFLNFITHARPDSSFEMRSNVSNGMYHGFSSGSKGNVINFPSAGVKPNASLGEVVKHQSFESLQGPRKQECSAGLPWLKPKPPFKSEISNGFLDLNASTNQFMDGIDTGDCLNSVSPQNGLSSASWSNNANMRRVQMTDPQSSRKIIGCPIFEKQSICKEEHASLISHSLCIADQRKEVNHLVKRDLDINLPCDASVSVDQHGGSKPFCVEKKEGNKAANFRHYIDLNSCASEDDEDSGLRSCLRVKRKGLLWIDLEAPPTLESEEEGEGESSQEKSKEETWGLMKGQDGSSMDELIKVAAQAIVAISLSDHQRHPDDAASSSTDAAAKSPLSWFAEIITSCGYEFERKIDGSPEATDCEGYREEYSSGMIDYFEAMTLNLQPTKEEEYMPKPLVPENLISEGTGYNRPRRGQARRGRPKRDFQRDILPGLSSLSRHEVTEDIQMLGGLLKTRDYTCNSGVAARRNSKRKRLVTNISQAPVFPSMEQPMNESVSMVGLEDSKLTGWGKATRRPRRQRCPPAGNPATVILT
ncbi:hypothetical protein EUTSA_v10006734mg [Eutrema salsugineum]|nr:uncharacterized protein LOC18992472 isoform X2 [Eutrema salsugineum]XP_024008187.1 uncharacterized protein LOC18992472 isoform X2 [Eutrema salsugineum]ESQ34291.1 hypothetical protein EUTSA_v10006734mg [Eutrema salsugineum]